MKPELLDLLIAIAAGASALAVLGMCGVGLIVWFAGRNKSRMIEPERED